MQESCGSCAGVLPRRKPQPTSLPQSPSPRHAGRTGRPTLVKRHTGHWSNATRARRQGGFHTAMLDWTAGASPRPGGAAAAAGGDGRQLSVVLHRPGRRAKDSREKAEDHERWRLLVSLDDGAAGGGARPGAAEVLEEFTVAPADFGGAREMGADAAVAGRLVAAEPLNGAAPLRNAGALRGRVALIERGGGQFVHLVRRAQEAGAAAAVIVDSREGPLFLMSTEPGSAGDDIRIPAVLLSLADSALVLGAARRGPGGGRPAPLRAAVAAEGVFRQTLRQLRHTPAARLRQREEAAWRVTFHGEGHEGFQGPYSEALSAVRPPPPLPHPAAARPACRPHPRKWQGERSARPALPHPGGAVRPPCIPSHTLGVGRSLSPRFLGRGWSPRPPPPPHRATARPAAERPSSLYRLSPHPDPRPAAARRACSVLLGWPGGPTLRWSRSPRVGDFTWVFVWGGGGRRDGTSRGASAGLVWVRKRTL